MGQNGILGPVQDTKVFQYLWWGPWSTENSTEHLETGGSRCLTLLQVVPGSQRSLQSAASVPDQHLESVPSASSMTACPAAELGS